MSALTLNFFKLFEFGRLKLLLVFYSISLINLSITEIILVAKLYNQ